jgi:hypothetical protein
MKSVFDWLAERYPSSHKAWLILGKGPSFSKYRQFDLSAFATLALNDSARELKVDLAHAIDLDVVRRSGQAISQNAKALVMPWHPHVNFNAGHETLEDHARKEPVLAELARAGKLLWYNLSTSADHRPGSPVVSAKFFSAEAALNVLATAGVAIVRSLGVDGGAAYSEAFDDLKEKSLLVNRQSTFDLQFKEIAKTILRTGIDFAPLDVQSPALVYVAATEGQMLAVKVLEYSIRKHASMTVRVQSLHESGIEVPQPRDPKNWPRTPFTFQRFLIPQITGYRGRAIYMDSDMQVFDDVRELWIQPFNGANLLAVGDTAGTGRRPQFSVMLLDCAALRWEIGNLVHRLDAGELTYEDLVYEMRMAGNVNASIPARWNSLETYREGETSLLHYTDMDTQPWVYAGNPNGRLWVQDLIEAVDAGFISEEYVQEHISKGWVRPSLMWQLEHREPEGLLLPRSARQLDNGFQAPYMSLPDQRGTARKLRPSAKAIVQALYRRSALSRLNRRIAARVWRR